MKQRLALAMALLNDPELLILDEPVNGLDPQGIIDIRNLIIKLNKEKGITIFISSHLLSEIEKTCTHVAIIHKGKVGFEGKIEDLKNLNNNITVKVKTDNCKLHLDNIVDLNPKEISLNEFKIEAENTNQVPAIIEKLVTKKVPIYEVITTGGLEDWFMNITKN